MTRVAVKFLHFADLDLDTPFRWASPELARSRRQALRDDRFLILPHPEVAVAGYRGHEARRHLLAVLL